MSNFTNYYKVRDAIGALGKDLHEKDGYAYASGFLESFIGTIALELTNEQQLKLVDHIESRLYDRQALRKAA